MRLVFFQHLQTLCKLDCPHGLTIAHFLQRVLVDSPAHECALGKFSDSLQLLISRYGIALPLVLDCLEFQQTQIFAFFPMLVRFPSDVDRRPIRNDVRALQ